MYVLYSRHLNLVENWSSCSHNSAGEKAVFVPPPKVRRCWWCLHLQVYPLQGHLTPWEGYSVQLVAIQECYWHLVWHLDLHFHQAIGNNLLRVIKCLLNEMTVGGMLCLASINMTIYNVFNKWAEGCSAYLANALLEFSGCMVIRD